MPSPTSREQQSDTSDDTPEVGEHLQAEGEEEIAESFDRSVEAGAQRLNRSWSNLTATGFMAGIDVGFGVLALLFVKHETGSEVLGGLAFTIGFLALALGRSELFTENFLVPVTTVITKNATVGQLGRLWGTTYVTNLAGGWLVALLLVAAYPDLSSTALETSEEIIGRGLSMESFVLAVLAGGAITLMTWMERNAVSEFGRLLAVVAFGFLLGAAQLNHVVVISIKIFAALLIGGTEYGYADWLQLSSLAAFGNMVGGLVLVTVLRLVQVGPSHIRRRQRTPMRPTSRRD
ncbi:formate/nitrite transporter family protein [Euzebya tangerina]|uniref:formate/nitrite transporter family protein n=1 Tax=Euzebya tangerina TaxID=591198 RepID=UPI000E318770|nr:formate/nitrite transporter family protein [Euzebya tangerina]